MSLKFSTLTFCIQQSGDPESLSYFKSLLQILPVTLDVHSLHIHQIGSVKVHQGMGKTIIYTAHELTQGEPNVPRTQTLNELERKQKVGGF